MGNLIKTDQVGVLDGTTTITNSKDLVDIEGLTIPAFTLNRPVMIVVYLTVVAKALGGSGGNIHIHVGGEVAQVQEVRIKVREGMNQITYTTHLMRELPVTGEPVSYTIKAQWQALNGSILEAQQRQISYMLFDKQ